MRAPCDEAVLRSGAAEVPCAERAKPWILTATILGSSMAFIDSTVVNVALPAIQAGFHATVVDVQWVVESYGLFLGALILVGGSLGDMFGRRKIFVVGVAHLLRGVRRLRLCLEHPSVDHREKHSRCRSCTPGTRKSRDHQCIFRRKESRQRDRYMVGIYCHHHRGRTRAGRLAG